MKKIYTLYKVGGCVRDKLLGVDSKDIDFAFEFSEEFLEKNSELSPDDFYNWMNYYLGEDGFNIFLQTADCFTTRARFQEGHQYEGLTADFVMCRKETYDDPETRKPTVHMGILYDDLQRRDFTVNAIAEDLEGNLIDPFGGIKDLKNKILRCPIDAKTSFNDDPLRMIRCLRFALTKDLQIDWDCSGVMVGYDIWKKFEKVVSRERVREELQRMFRFDTIKTLRILNEYLPEIVIEKYILGTDIWLKPTVEKR